jgi:hypothetical protein
MIILKKILKTLSSMNVILLLLLLTFPLVSLAESRYFLGLEPQFHQEDWYEEDELDSNIFPLVYEQPFMDHFGLRIRSNVYLHTGGTEGTAISLVGLGATWLWYLRPRNEHGLHGFNIGPTAIFGYDFLDEITHTTLALETGYALAIKDTWTLNASVQYGRSYFSDEAFPDSSHFGLYINLGRWF